MSEQKCCICSQIMGESKNDLIAQMLKWKSYIRRIPLERELFAVIPSLGPIVPGHTLLCPKRHYKSFGTLPYEYEEEYTYMKNRLTELLQNAYGLPVHYFEHGMARKGIRVICTVEHAHMHFVPAHIDVWEILEKQMHWQTVGKRLEDLSSAVGEMEYLYYESPDLKRKIVKSVPGTFESQYLRKVFAKVLGSPDKWDWRNTPSPLEAHEIYERILGATNI